MHTRQEKKIGSSLIVQFITVNNTVQYCEFLNDDIIQ